MRADDIIESYEDIVSDIVSSGQGQMDWENPTKAVDVRKAIDDYLAREEAQIKIEKDVLAEIDNDPVYQARIQAIADSQDEDGYEDSWDTEEPEEDSEEEV